MDLPGNGAPRCSENQNRTSVLYTGVRNAHYHLNHFGEDQLRRIPLLAVSLLVGASTAAAGQEAHVLQAGDMAPDFELVGSTRFGRLSEPVRLSDFRGKTVVLAFYYQARTPG
jgi:AhpC/TSA family